MTGDDSELLERYTAKRCPKAFNELVARYGRLVYSSAVRQLRDAHLAEDVTQAVFIVLARKAHTIHKGASLGAWLVKVTSYAAANARRRETLRKKREEEAAAMELKSNVDAEAREETSAVLDSALAKLADRERSVLVMHFLQGMSYDEVASSLGISRDAASKRSSRGIEKLRELFARTGLAMPSIAVTQLLMQLPTHPMPAGLAAGLAQSALGAATAVGGATSGSAAMLAHTVMHAGLASSSGKLAAVAVVLLVAALAVGILLMPAAPTNVSAATQTPTTIPALVVTTRPATAPALTGFTKIDESNFTFGEARHGDFEHDIKADDTGKTVGFLRSVKPKAINASYNTRIMAFGFLNQRIRISSNMKCKDVDKWAAMWVSAGDWNGRMIAFDNMSGRPLVQTRDWSRSEIVIDVPGNCAGIGMGFMVLGSGELTFETPTIEIVGKDVPTTYDVFHLWSDVPAAYSVATDDTVKRDGHATTRISSTAAGINSWAFWIRDEFDGAKYAGKKLRVSAMIKSKGVVIPSGIAVRLMGRNFKGLRFAPPQSLTIRGDTDWKKYETIVDVPQATELVSNGVKLNGPGTIWVDDIHWEPVE